MAKAWIIRPPARELSQNARRWSVPPVVAQLLINRGLDEDDPVRAFLTPRLTDLYPPHSLPGVTQAAEMIVRAVRSHTPIALYGDYDVDGTTGVAILWHVLQGAGADVTCYVPHRLDEGYGVNPEAISRLIQDGAGLIITVDCGITAFEVAESLTDEPVSLIITDHHTPGSTFPPADVIVHPTIKGGSPNPHLCGAGVAFKLAWETARQFGGADRVDASFRVLLVELLGLAALGTIADVVPLVGENRIIAKYGLAGLVQSRLPGVRALIESSGLNGRRINGMDVGFKLAPRINAAGRMGHAKLAVELFTEADAKRAREIALYLEEHNRSRQATERQIRKQGIDMIETRNLATDARRAIVLASEGWHAGVIGIVAARLVERYRRPTVLIALSDGEGQGSARSIRHFDLSASLAMCKEHLLACGGHAMAAGLRISAGKVDAFTEAFVRIANNRLTGDDLREKLRIDVSVALSDLTIETAEAIAGLGPFGTGNPRPKLVTDWVELADEPRLVGQRRDHLQASFCSEGACVRAIGFGLGDRIEDLKQHRRCRVAFEPIINEFNGRRSVEMKMIDLKFPD